QAHHSYVYCWRCKRGAGPKTPRPARRRRPPSRPPIGGSNRPPFVVKVVQAEVAMPRANIRIRLTGRAVDLALAPPRAGAAGLNPLARVILERATIDPPGSGGRLVVCTPPEARALLDHFSGLVDVLIGL